MQTINTLSLTSYVNEWLVDSRHPRVLHIFDCACNLINERGEVLSIVAPQIGNGPFNIVVNDKVLFSEHLNLQSPISSSANQLHLGDLTIHTANASIWNPYPDWERLHARKDDIGHQLTQLPITNYPNLGGFDLPLEEPSRLFNHRGLQIPQSLVSNLSLALVNADISSALKITSQISGLGIGLTPAGDDYIMGAIYAVWIIHPPTTARVLAQEIADTAAPLTTSLSAAWLRSVGRGEVGILWHEFFDALISADGMRILQAIDKILAVGETSGADALAGFTDVFSSWKISLLHE